MDFALERKAYRKMAGRQKSCGSVQCLKDKISLVHDAISASRIRENDVMQLRNFEKQDASILADKMYGNLSIGQIEDMICAWNTKQYDGKYFDMLAVVDNDVIVGMLSLYQIKEKTLHIGPVIFPGFRKKGFCKSRNDYGFRYSKRIGLLYDFSTNQT